MNFCITGVLSTVLIWPVLGGITYHWKVTPERPAINNAVIVEFWLEDFQGVGIGELKIWQRLISATGEKSKKTIFEVAEGRCQYSPVSWEGLKASPVRLCNDPKLCVHSCDHAIGKYSFIIQKLRKYVRLFAWAKDQVPNKSGTVYIDPYKPPNNLFIANSIPRTVNINEKVELDCRFSGGENNFGYFSFDRVNSSKSLPLNTALVPSSPTPNGRIVGEIKPDHYGTSASLSWTARRGDEGWYQCHAVYDPSKVGNFTSDPVYVNVVYPPVLGHTDGYADHIEAALGENITFSLPIIANPVATAVWVKGSERLKNDGKFIIKSYRSENGSQYFQLSFFTEENDFGLYKCNVTNDQGQQTVSFLLDRERSPDSTILALLIVIAIVIIVIVVVVSVVVVLRFKPFNNRAKTADPQAMNARYQANEMFRAVGDGYMEPTNLMNGHI